MFNIFSRNLDRIISHILRVLKSLSNVIYNRNQNKKVARFSIKEQVLFAKRLAFLSEAGVSIIASLEILTNQTKTTHKKKLFQTVRADVLAGKSLASALNKYPKIFGEFTINIINVGEQSGTLSLNLNYLADELNKKHKLQRQIRSALMYPLFISITTFGVTGLLISYIFPKIMPIFLSLNIKLPLLTRVLISVSNFLQNYGLITVFIIFIFIIMFIIGRKSLNSLHTLTDFVVIKLPIVGHISRSYNCANFCRTMSLNLKSGVNLTKSLEITGSVLVNNLYKNSCLKFIDYVNRGENISLAMKNYSELYPAILIHIISIGEKTGKLGDSLAYLSSQYEQDVEESTKNLSESIEPILLLTMGILVGVIAISIITPIYEVTKFLGSGH